MCWMRALSTTMVLVKWVVAIKPWCAGHHCVVVQSLHHRHPTMCVHHCVCGLMYVMWACVTNSVCCDWRRLVGLVVGCMALPSTCVPLCHLSQMALTTHGHFLLHNTNWIARGPGDLPSCIGWLFCDHSFFLFSFRPQLSLLLSQTILSSQVHFFFVAWRWPLAWIWCYCKYLIIFLPIPVVDCLMASIMWCLDGTVFVLNNCLCVNIWCIRYMSCYVTSHIWLVNAVL